MSEQIKYGWLAIPVFATPTVFKRDFQFLQILPLSDTFMGVTMNSAL